MNKIKQKITKIHFYLLVFIILNFIVQLLCGLSLNSKIIFSLKIVLYLSGFILFFLNCKPFRKASLYFSFYVISSITIVLFWLFGGIFLGLISSILLFSIYPKELKYEKENLKVYSKFSGFLGACCTYEIVENTFFIFEKKYGEIKLEEAFEINKSDLKIENDSIIYKHEIENYNVEKNRYIKSDTIEKIKIE